MEVRPGYKQSEIGVIPEDWDVKKLGDCLIGAPDYSINAPAVPYSGRLPAYIRITDITNDGYFSKENITSVECADTEKYSLNVGDIVFARTGASVGKSCLYNPDDGQLVFAGFLIRVKPNPTSQLPIPLPPLPEQRAIAEVLSDVDALIAALDCLIAKKRAIKQGAMQQLLTGKTPLPGFSGEWEVKKLGDVFNVTADFQISIVSSSSPRTTRHRCRPLRHGRRRDARFCVSTITVTITFTFTQ